MIDVVVDGTVTSVAGLGSVVFSVGDPFSLTISLEGATPDGDPSPDRFDASLPGHVTGPLLSAASVTQVVADAAAGTWVATGSQTVIFGVDIAFTVAMAGTGLLPGQLLPHFDQIDGAFAVYDTGGGVDAVAAQLTSVTIIPEPGTGALLTLGLAGLGAARTRRRAGRPVATASR